MGIPPENVLVEVVDEVVEVLLVRLWGKAFTSDPFNVVPLVNGVVLLHLLGQEFVSAETDDYSGSSQF